MTQTVSEPAWLAGQRTAALEPMREARRLGRQRRRVVWGSLSAGRARDAPALAPPEEIGVGNDVSAAAPLRGGRGLSVGIMPVSRRFGPVALRLGIIAG
jgi:hypothetical protein